MKPIQIPPAGGKKINVLGIPMVIRIHGRDTGGGVSVVESHDLPGGGPPPHIHRREDETFQILEGEYEWTVGGKTFIAKKGSTIFAPRGIPHTYRYLGKTPGRLMCVITPAGFEGFFEEIGALSPQQQQDIPRVMEIAKKFGLQILPPPGAKVPAPHSHTHYDETIYGLGGVMTFTVNGQPVDIAAGETCFIPRGAV